MRERERGRGGGAERERKGVKEPIISLTLRVDANGEILVGEGTVTYFYTLFFKAL